MRYILLFCIIFSASISYSQNDTLEPLKRKNELAISFNSHPFYRFSGYRGYAMFTISGEYITGKHLWHKTSYSLIWGGEWSGNAFDYHIFGGEITKIIGKRKYFLEIGGGISSTYDILVIYPKVGGRVNIGKHFLIKASYMHYMRSNFGGSYLFTIDHFASLSIGYRFNLVKKK